MENKSDFRDIKKLNKDGTFTIIRVDWNKLPYNKCDRRYHITCLKDYWNRKGEYCVY